MSQLRDQLHQARQDYNTLSYPGDLATQLLPGRKRNWRLLLPIAGGLAAAVAFVMVLRTPEAPSTKLSLVESPIELVTTQPVAAARYSFPDRLPLSLPVSPLMAATPPVNVSLTGLQDWRLQSYDEIGPKLRQHLSFPGVIMPMPKPGEVAPEPTTQQAV